MRPMQLSMVSMAVIAGGSMPVWPTMSGLAKFTSMKRAARVDALQRAHHAVGDRRRRIAGSRS